MKNHRWWLLIVLMGNVSLTLAQEKPSLTSPAFHDHATLPVQYTCDGKGLSPALVWENLPTGTKSLALVVSDPDAPDPAAPKVTWIHWVLYDIPVTAKGLPEAVIPQELPLGTRQGLNSWKRTSYGAPCPPIGRHRYFFTLYMLDTVLPDLKTPTSTTLEAAMSGHVLNQTELVGTYQRTH